MAVIYRDLFTSSIGAGWTVNDSGSNLSIVSERLLFDGGLGSPAWDDPRLVYTTGLSRATLGAFSVLMRFTNNSDDGPRVSLSPSSSDSAAANSSTITYDYPNTLAGWQPNRLRGWAIDLLYIIVPRPGGGFWRFISGGEYGTFPTATFVGISGTESDGTLYAHISNRNSVFYVDNATLCDTASLPAALTTRWGPSLAADDFGSGASLSGRSTPYGSKSWSVAAGSGSISGGTLTVAASTTAQFNAGAQARIIEAYVTRADSGSKGFLYFRGDGTHAGSWRVECVSDRVALYAPSGLIDQTGAITFTEDVQYHVRVVDWANHIEVFVNGTEYVQTDDTNQAGQTQVGVGTDAGGTFLVDDLSVWPATVTLNADFGPFSTVPAATGSPISTNTFTGADGTALATHDANWTVHAGGFDINSNRIRATTAGTICIASRSTSPTGVDHAIEGDITMPSTTPTYPVDWVPGFVVRYTDTDDFIMGRFLYQSDSPEVEVWQEVADTGTLIGYTNLGTGSLAPSSVHHLEIAVAGTEVAAYWNGNLVVQATTTITTSARAGMIRREENVANLSGTPFWDNVEISAASATGPPTISNLQVVGLTSTTATISWNTNIAAVGRVNYGLTSSYGTTTSDTPSGTSHSRILSGLTASTTYHYSAEASTSSTVSTSDATFTTLGAGVGAGSPGVPPAIPLVEIALTTAPTLSPAWTDVSQYVVSWSFTRGRQSELDSAGAGTYELVLRNDDRRFDPSYTSGPYYGSLKRMRRVRQRAAYGGSIYDLYHGYVREWTVYREPSGQQFVRVTADDGLRVLGLAELNGDFIEQRTDERVAAVLDAAGWQTGTPWILGDATYSLLDISTALAPLGDRSLDVGLSQVQAVTLSHANALDHLQAVERTELGLVFVSNQGAVVFHNRQRRLRAGSQAPLAIFGEVEANGELPYVFVSVEFDERFLFNEVRVTRTEGIEQTAQDTTSQADHFKRTLRRDSLCLTDSEALAAAGYLVNRYKDPPPRITELVLDPHFGIDALWTRFLGAELGQVVTVRYRPWGGGNVLEQVSVVESLQIGWQSEIGMWGGRWVLSPADTSTYWVLDASLLGTSTALGI